jgi:hypothetical protein
VTRDNPADNEEGAAPAPAEIQRRAALQRETLRVEALRAETLRVNDRYLREVVLGFGLCPWAERAIDGGELRRAVVFDQTPGVEVALAFIDELRLIDQQRPTDQPALTGREASVGMLIFPCAALSSPAFDRYTEEVRRADRDRCRGLGRTEFVMAAFHPGASESFETPYQLVSFVRRTPDPTIQLVRAELLEQIRAARPAVSDDLALQNYATVKARGPAELDAVLRDIRRDRDQSHAALG